MLTFGSIPQSVRDTLPASILPNFTSTDLEFYHGSSDFFSIDPYTSVYTTSPPNSSIESCASNPSNPLYPQCVATTFTRDTWQIGYEGNPSTYVRLPLQLSSFRCIAATLQTIIELMLF